MRGSDYFEMSEFETFENKEPVWNWIPPPVTPGKLLTITDLKERWMKQKEEEKQRAEREAREKVVRQRSDEATMENRVADDRRRRERVENRGRSGFRGSKAVVDVEDDDVRYGDRDGEVMKMRNERNVDVRNTSRGKQVGGRNRGMDGRRWGGRREFGGVRGGDLARVEKPEVGPVWDLEYKKEVLQLDDEKIDGDEQAVKHNPKLAGGYYSGKASSHNGRGVEAKVYERDENGVGGENVAEKKKGGLRFEQVISEDDEQLTGQACWYHSLSENQHSDGYWVCKFIRTVPETEAEESTQGSEVVEGNMVDTAKKKNRTKEQEVGRQVGEVCGEGRNYVTVDRVRKEATEMDGEFSRMVSHGDKSRKAWQPWRRREMHMGVTEEVAVEQVKTEAVKVSKDNMFNQGGSYQKNDVKHKPRTVEPSVEIEEQFEASAATDWEAHRKGKFRARSNAVDGIKMHGSGTFKAERNIGSSAMEHPKKEAVHVDSSHKRVINEVGSQVKNYGPTLKPETMEPVEHSSFEVEVKSEAPEVTGRIIDSSYDRNGDWKMYGNGRFKTERSFSPSTGGQVIKEAIHVNIDDPKIVNQDDKLTKNERVITRPVTVKPVGAASDEIEKSETTEVTESGTKTRVTKVDGRKMVKDFGFNTEKNFGYKGFTNPKKFNGRMKEVQLEKRGLVWVKKGEASVSNTGGED